MFPVGFSLPMHRKRTARRLQVALNKSKGRLQIQGVICTRYTDHYIHLYIYICSNYEIHTHIYIYINVYICIHLYLHSNAYMYVNLYSDYSAYVLLLFSSFDFTPVMRFEMGPTDAPRSTRIFLKLTPPTCRVAVRPSGVPWPGIVA